MPWKEIRIVDQRLQFLSSYQKEEMSVADLCRAYELSPVPVSVTTSCGVTGSLDLMISDPVKAPAFGGAKDN